MGTGVDVNDWIGLSIGEGRYRIVRPLGAGGMGTVFRARDTRLQSDVVLKVPHPAFLAADATFARRFQREIQSLVSLVHPHVARILDVGEHEGLPFLVMAYLGGGSLNDRRPRDEKGRFKTVKPETLSGWLMQVAEALDFIHAQGFIHRDIKPENILFDKHGNAYLSDFGIAKAVGEGTAQETNLTGGGAIGTPGYIAPEILLGQDYDARSDQYALAVTVYELLAGRSPFRAPTPEALIAVQLTKKVPDLKTIRPHLPAELCAAVMRGLEREPEKRYPDCRSFAEAVRTAVQFSSSGSVPSVPTDGVDVSLLQEPSLADQTRRTDFSSPTSQRLSVTAEFVPQQRERHPSSVQLAPQSPQITGGQSSARAQTSAASLPPDPAQLLPQRRPPIISPRMRFWAALVGALITGTVLLVYLIGDKQQQSTTPRPEDQSIASIKEGDDEGLREPGKEQTVSVLFLPQTTLHGHSRTVTSVTFSPDGKRILTGSLDKSAILWNAETGEQIRLLHGHADSITSVAFSPDGKRILTGSFDKTAILWNAETGTPIQTLRGHSGVVYSVTFSRDGKRIATGSADKTVILWNAETGKQNQTLRGHSFWVSSVAFSLDGRRLVTGSGDKMAILWNAATGEQIRTLSGHSDLVSAVSFSPDGKQILSASWDDTAILWNAETGEQIRTLQDHSAKITSAVFSSDGKRILTGSLDKTAILWNVKSGEIIQTLRGHSGSVWSVAFSPDGRRIATGSADNTAIIWQVEE